MSIRSRMWEKHEVNLGPVVRRALSVSLLLTLTFVAVAQDPPAAQPPLQPRLLAPRPAHRPRKLRLRAPRPCGSWWANPC